MPGEPFAALRWRLTAQFTALMLAVLVLGALAFYGYMRHALLAAANAVNDLAALSVLETVAIDGPMPRARQPEFDEELAELRQTLGLELVQLWGDDGQVLASDRNVVQRALPRGPAHELLEVDGRRMVVSRVPVGLHGTLVVGRPETLVVEQLNVLARGLLLIVPLILLAALAAGWLMAGQSIRPLQRSFDEQRAFMADASHELRTPLAVILTQSEVALDRGDSAGSPFRAPLSVIARTAKQLGRLVDDLLFLARADAGALSPRSRVFPMRVLLEECVEAFEPLAKERGFTLHLQLPEGDSPVDADPEHVHRLIGIVLDNAIRYAIPGRVDVRVAARGERVELEISDQGPGISPELLPRVFHRFSRGDASRSARTDGAGLGLAIARAIAEANGGSLSLDSSAAGTVARVQLASAQSQP